MYPVKSWYVQVHVRNLSNPSHGPERPGKANSPQLLQYERLPLIVVMSYNYVTNL
jgi:hypothetical protein